MNTLEVQNVIWAGVLYNHSISQQFETVQGCAAFGRLRWLLAALMSHEEHISCVLQEQARLLIYMDRLHGRILSRLAQCLPRKLTLQHCLVNALVSMLA